MSTIQLSRAWIWREETVPASASISVADDRLNPDQLRMAVRSDTRLAAAVNRILTEAVEPGKRITSVDISAAASRGEDETVKLLLSHSGIPLPSFSPRRGSGADVALKGLIARVEEAERASAQRVKAIRLNSAEIVGDAIRIDDSRLAGRVLLGVEDFMEGGEEFFAALADRVGEYLRVDAIHLADDDTVALRVDGGPTATIVDRLDPSDELLNVIVGNMESHRLNGGLSRTEYSDVPTTTGDQSGDSLLRLAGGGALPHILVIGCSAYARARMEDRLLGLFDGAGRWSGKLPGAEYLRSAVENPKHSPDRAGVITVGGLDGDLQAHLVSGAVSSLSALRQMGVVVIGTSSTPEIQRELRVRFRPLIGGGLEPLDYQSALGVDDDEAYDLAAMQPMTAAYMHPDLGVMRINLGPS